MEKGRYKRRSRGGDHHGCTNILLKCGLCKLRIHFSNPFSHFSKETSRFPHFGQNQGFDGFDYVEFFYGYLSKEDSSAKNISTPLKIKNKKKPNINYLVIHRRGKGRFKTHMKCFRKVQNGPVSVLITLWFVAVCSSGAETWCVHAKRINEDVHILTVHGSGDIPKFHEFSF